MSRDPVCHLLSEIHFFLPEFYFFSLLSFPRIPELPLAPGRPGPADPSEELARQDGQWQSRTFGADPAARELDEAVPAAGAHWASGTLGGADFAGAQHPWLLPWRHRSNALKNTFRTWLLREEI